MRETRHPPTDENPVRCNLTALIAHLGKNRQHKTPARDLRHRTFGTDSQHGLAAAQEPDSGFADARCARITMPHRRRRRR